LALEAAAAIDIAYEDVFDRLSHLYASRKRVAELAGLLERRIGKITDPDERLAMEVKRGRALLEADDVEGARNAFETVLAERPEDAGALSAFADLCVSQRDWDAAEQALVRLARLLPTAEQQRDVYARLGELYAVHLLNLSRAEVALKEVLKRAPEDVETIEKLVDVYQRQNDAAHAAELQHELVSKASSPEEKRKRMLALAAIHEETAQDKRRAEQTLEAARREFPQDVEVLRALAEFYTRHQQTPAVNILLDRAGGDARRALAAGRVSPALFEVLSTVFELRGKADAARVTRSIMAALGGQAAEIAGAGHRAFDRKVDDLLAPEGLTPPVRALLAKTGDALDQVSPVDLRALRATPLPAEHPLARLAEGVGQAIGLSAVQLLVSPKLGAGCLAVGSSPPTVVVGEALSGSERFAAFLVLRALKLVQAKASALARTSPADLAVLISAWLKCLNPAWQPQGVNAALINAAGGRLQAVLPRNLPPEVATIALEAAGVIGAQPAALGAQAIAWADRVAFLALGDTSAALDAIAAVGGAAAGAPRDLKERAAWVARTPAARELLAFAVTDAFAEARARLGVN
jgi:tetratricopeptide (TPR) repeat protein